jgi:hypothetical protein
MLVCRCRIQGLNRKEMWRRVQVMVYFIVDCDVVATITCSGVCTSALRLTSVPEPAHISQRHINALTIAQSCK